MPALTSLALLSTAASSLLQAAGHVVDALHSDKTSPAKKTDGTDKATDGANLTGAFAAYLTACLAAAAGTPVTPPTSPATAGNGSQNGSAKSEKTDVASASSPTAQQAQGQNAAGAIPLALLVLPAAVAIPAAVNAQAGVNPLLTTKLPATSAAQPTAAGQAATGKAIAATAKSATTATANASASAAAAQLTAALVKASPAATATGTQTEQGQTTRTALPGQTPATGSPASPSAAPAIVPVSHEQKAAPAILSLPDVPASKTASTPAVSALPVATDTTRTDAPAPHTPQVADTKSPPLAMLPISDNPHSFLATQGSEGVRALAAVQTQGSVQSLHHEDKSSPQGAALPMHGGDTSGAQTSALSAPPPVVAAGSVQNAPTGPAVPLATGAAANVPVTDQIARAFVAQAHVVQRDGQSDFHLRLEPPQLGSVQIHLRATDHTISARVVVAQEGTRQLIEGQANDLRQSLAASGLVLGSFDVTHQGGGASSGGHHQPPEPPAPTLFTAPAATPAAVAKTSRLIPTGGIDILA